MMKQFLAVLIVSVLALTALGDEEKPVLPESPEELTKLLEKRWPLTAIQRYCVPKNQFDPKVQNLVINSKKIWKGVLYEGKETGLDKISWYAGVNPDGIEYSLNVRKGDSIWLLEIGDEKTMKKPLREKREY